MANTIETLWKLILDKDEATKGESLIQRLSRVIKDKLGREGADAINETTEALERQNRQLKENEEQAKRTGKATGDSGGGLVDTAGSVGGAAGKFRGVASLVGGGEAAGLVNDLGDAIEAFGEMRGTIGGLIPQVVSFVASLGLAALPLGALVVAIGVLVAATAAAAAETQKHADIINSTLDKRRELDQAVREGLTSDEATKQLEDLKAARQDEIDTLADIEAAYKQAMPITQGAADAWKLLNSEEEALASQADKSRKAIADMEAGISGLEQRLGDGTLATNDAKAAAEKTEDAEKSLADTRTGTSVDAAKDTERAEKDAERERQRAAEKAQADAERQAEEARRAQQQAEEKRYQAAVKYSDALVEIANKTSDGAKQALEKQRQGLVDSETSARRDLSAIADDFNIAEREEAFERREEEINDLRQHGNKLAGIRDEALNTEKDFLRKRDFLSATKVREQAISEQEAENRAFMDGQGEKETLRRAEDARELRELADTRLKRRQQLASQNEDVRLSYQREITAGREARRTMERDAKLNRDREVRDANAQARAYLGIKSQQSQAELTIAQQTLNAIRSMGNTTNNTTVNNNQRSVGNISISGGSMNPAAVRQTMYEVLGEIGVV